MTSAPDEAGRAAAKYDALLALSRDFEAAGEELRDRARLGDEILGDEAVTASAGLSPATWEEAERDIRTATGAKGGLLDTSTEADADALMIRATVMTYRWIDELREAAERTLGSVAGRAIGYLPPEVSLGGAIVSAGLIETEADDRDGLAAYLNELAATHPDLLDHFTSGGGGLLDRLRMRALLTVGVLGGEQAPAAATAGLRRTGAPDFAIDGLHALRDVAGGLLEDPAAPSATAAAVNAAEVAAPVNVEELVARLTRAGGPLVVERLAEDRYVCFLPEISRRGAVRLVGTDHAADAGLVAESLTAALPAGARVLLVGGGRGGLLAAAVASSLAEQERAPRVEQIVTVGTSSTDLAVPPEVRVLALEDRADPVALLGSLIAAGAAAERSDRLTVVYDAGDETGPAAWLAGGRAADSADNPALREELARLSSAGFLAAS